MQQEVELNLRHRQAAVWLQKHVREQKCIVLVQVINHDDATNSVEGQTESSVLLILSDYKKLS